MIKLLKTNIPLVYAISILFVFIGALSVFIQENSFQDDFFVWYSSSVKSIQNNATLNYIISAVFLLLTGFVINRAFNKTSFYLKTTALPIFIFLIILSTFGGFYFDSTYIISLIFSFLFLKLIELDQNRTAIHIGFITGIIIGFSFLFSYWLLPIGLLLLFSLNVFRPFNWREWAVSILGMILPMFYLLSLKYLIHGSISLKSMPIQSAIIEYNWIDYLSFSILILITLISLIKLRNQFKYILNIERKQVNILTFFTFLTFAISASIYWVYGIKYLLFIVPLALLLSIPILNAKHNGMLNTLFIALVILNLLRIFVF
ncbi:MAG: hypothetical protein AB8B74_03555 [Crocinitomicaceae bacterium]